MSCQRVTTPPANGTRTVYPVFLGGCGDLRLEGLDAASLLRVERAVCGQHLFRCRFRERPGEQISLRVGAAEALELTRLHLGFDTLGDDAGVHGPSQREDAFDDRRPIRQE